MRHHLTASIAPVALGALMPAVVSAFLLTTPVAAMAAAPATGGALATPRQIALEASALRILASAPMQAEIRRVEALYAADPQGATATGRATIKRAAESIAMAAIQYAIGEDTDRPAVLWVVNAPHAWFGMQVPRSGYGIDNPDNVYRNIMVDGAARYEIRGQVKRPGPAELHFELRDSIPGTAAMAAEGGKQLGTLRNDAMQIAADGSFTITLDSAPANGRPNHMQMPAEGKFLLIVRDLFTDWKTQNPVALEIDRVAGPAVAPAPSEEAMARRAAQLLSQIAPYWVAYDNQYVFTKPVNHIGTPRVRPGGRGFSTGGHFSLAADEAWIVTLRSLGAVSLGFQITDPWGVAYDYVGRTSSLNTAQARPNADGSYTFVISARDPGVYNWLDPEGYAAGLYAVRWQSLPPGAAPEAAVKESKVVSFDQLKQALPPETRFITPAERKAQQKERSRSHQRRLEQ
ncbi:Protein of unknown function [Sphingomonas laterariae]|uniref:DUF1214 domain-containing protein n=1 Tax=Edaphosphingomonas laterariae TaxID=861865 RepID=A0A239BFQ9_9SPHN|nr:DUF1214 domain-containing protein [Sphingomonas laterariae]SNS06341.1 Protein of unknown function [Sphingomonas laterariae]